MRFPAILSSRKLRIGLGVLLLGFIAYTALGFWLVPRLVRSHLLGFATEQYQRTASVGEISFNPFTLVLEIGDFSLPDADGAQLLGFRRLMLNLEMSSVWRGGASLAEVALEQPYARVLLRQDGSLNLADLANIKSTGGPRESDQPPGIYIDSLSVSQGRVAFEDRARQVPFATELTPITFELRDFGTVGENGNAYALRAASVSGESFSWSGNFSLAPFASSGKFEVAALKARTIWSYLHEVLAFEFTRGSIDLQGEYSFAAGEQGGLTLDLNSARVTDLALRPPGKQRDYVEVAALEVAQGHVDVRARRVQLGRIRLDGGALHAARESDGHINLFELAANSPTPAIEATPAAAGVPQSAPPAPDAAPTWVVAAPDIAITEVRVDFDDRLVQPAVHLALAPVALSVTGFSTAPGTRFQFDASAQGEQAGKLQLRGETDVQGVFGGHVDVGGLSLPVLQPYLSTYTQITLNSGSLEAALDLGRKSDGAFNARGQVIVNDLDTIDNELRQELVKWQRLTVDGIDFDTSPARLIIKRIDARAPYARLVISPDQTLNIARLFKPAAGSQPPAVQTVRDGDDKRGAPGGNPGAMRVAIGSIRVTGGSANFADFWIKPNYAVSIQELRGTVVGLSSEPASRAKVDLKGKVDRYAPAQIQGEINLLSAALFTDLHVKFDGVEMTSVTPYSGHFAGYEIEKGKLSIDVAYLVEDRQLSARQKFVIDQLQLGDRVESPDAVKLPLKLAVALLKDRNGVINIDLPLSGSLDDPKFRMGPLIWKAFVGLLTKIATAPFALLARLGGGQDDEINRIDFEPGTPQLDAAAQERMSALAKALVQRPALQLEVPTSFAPEADGQAIAQAGLDERLRAAGASPDMDEPQRFELLRKQYEKEVGRDTPLPAAALSVLELRRKKDQEVPYAAGIEQLNTALLERQPASAAELDGLARARAQAIRDALLAGGQVDAARVFLLGIKPVAEVDGKVRVELALK